MEFPQLHQIRRVALAALATAAAYYLAGALGHHIGTYVGGIVSVIWPAAGVAAAAAVRFGYAGVLGVFLGALAVVYGQVDSPVAPVIGFGAALGAWVVYRFSDKYSVGDFLFGSIPCVVRFFLLGIPIGGLTSALIGTASLLYSGQITQEQYGQALWAWWSGDLLGAVILAPLLLTANLSGWRLERKVFKLEWALVSLATVFMAWLLFNRENRQLGELGEFLLFPLVLWVALRFSAGGVAAVVFFASIARIVAEVLQSGSIGQLAVLEILNLQMTLVSAGVGGYLVVAALSERRESEQRLDKLANHDPLTGLANRTYFQVFLEHAIAQCVRNGGQVSLLFIDLDRFKHINDSRGHEVGDEVLRIVASRLIDALRTDDFVARLGGDEFAVVMSHPKTQRAARRVALKLIESLSEPFEIEGNRYSISASIGISVCPDDGTDANTLLRQADLAMYQAKQKRGGFEYFSDEMNALAHEQLQIENGLRQAIMNEDFAVLYQPKVDLRTGKMCGMEALIRWFGEEGKIIGPDKFIPVAEETGLIVPIGHWVLKKACQHWVEWDNAGLNPPAVSVNLSPRQFSHGGLAQDILGAVKDTGMNPEFLGLEITESTAMDNPVVTLQVLAEMGGSGIEMMIDDFGTGHSNLRQLKRLPIGVLKIDKSFVRDILTDNEDAEITLAIIRLAHSLGLRVVAEGVETPEVAAFLKERKCDEIQGYLIGKPMPPEAIKELFSKTYTFG